MKKHLIALSLTTLSLAACGGSATVEDSTPPLQPVVEKDSTTPLVAIDDLRAQAEAGNVEAMFSMGASYDEGIDVPQDLTLARQWFEKAAAKGHAEALFNLGVYYSEGQGVPVDQKKALDYFTQSAEKGDMRAQYNLGVMAYQGRAMEQDFKKALQFFQQSALQGMPDAAFNLGVMYVKGEGTARSDIQGLAWFKIAQDLGDDKAPAAVIAASEGIPSDMVGEVAAMYENLKGQVRRQIDLSVEQ